jgi:hypothetical protein
VFFTLSSLVHGFFIVIHAEPLHALHELVDGILGGTFQVGVFDTEKESSLVMSCFQPVEDGGTDISNVDLSCGGRCESCSEIHDISYAPEKTFRRNSVPAFYEDRFSRFFQQENPE